MPEAEAELATEVEAEAELMPEAEAEVELMPEAEAETEAEAEDDDPEMSEEPALEVVSEQADSE
jgi:hypothetical protein